MIPILLPVPLEYANREAAIVMSLGATTIESPLRARGGLDERCILGASSGRVFGGRNQLWL